MKNYLVIFSVHIKKNILFLKESVGSLGKFGVPLGNSPLILSKYWLPFSSAVRCPALHREIPSAPEAAISSWWP